MGYFAAHAGVVRRAIVIGAREGCCGRLRQRMNAAIWSKWESGKSGSRKLDRVGKYQTVARPSRAFKPEELAHRIANNAEDCSNRRCDRPSDCPDRSAGDGIQDLDLDLVLLCRLQSEFAVARIAAGIYDTDKIARRQLQRS